MTDTKHLGEDELILHYYGEADDPAACEGHLQACGACRARFESLQSTLNAVEAPAIPWRPADYGSEVWGRVESSLGEALASRLLGRRARVAARWRPWWPLAWTPASSPWWKSGVAPRAAMRPLDHPSAAAALGTPGGKARRPSISGICEGGATQPGGMQRRPNAAGLPPRAAWLALAGACVALPLIGFLVGLRWSSVLGRTVARTGVVADTVSPERVRARILLITVGDHLERSQMALVELVNAESDRAIDISSEQIRVEDLLAANRLYRQTASEEGEPAVADLLDELERVLVEIARSPSTLSAAELSRLRTRIEERGILFKVKVLGTRIREDAQRPFTLPTS
jgi:hypothetical protein